MSDVRKIFGLPAIQQGELKTPDRQSIEQTEDYAVKKVVATQELSGNPKLVNFTPGSVLFVDSNKRISESNSGLYFDSSTGYLGVGYSSPSSPIYVRVASSSTSIPQSTLYNTSSGDCSYEVNIVGDCYIFGIDNSDNDKFKISYANTAGGGVLGTNDRLSIDSSGDVIVVNNFSAKTVSTLSQNIFLGVGVTNFTISSNVINLTGDAGGNVITALFGGIDGQVITIRFLDILVTLVDGVGLINLSGGVNLASAADLILQLVYTNGQWYEVSRCQT